MKRVKLLVALILVSMQAFGADLPVPASFVPVVPAYYNWTGFYIGGNLGAAVGKTSFSDTLVRPSTFSSSSISSFIGGGQLGVNYEFGGGVVIGAEAMFDWLSSTPTTFTASNPRTGSANGTINNRWITAVTGKLGYAWDRLLVYGKGGGAWVGTDNSLTVGATPAGVSVNSGSGGWTRRRRCGMGPCGFNWSARAEYDFIGLQNQNFTVSLIPATPFAGDAIGVNNRTIQMITAGLNYKLGVW